MCARASSLGTWRTQTREPKVPSLSPERRHFRPLLQLLWVDFKAFCLYSKYAKKPLCPDVLRETMDQSGVLLWVKAEPFIVGSLQVPPPSKFSLHYLRKIASYVRTRATEGAYPRLYWSTWRHIACGKLQLAKDLAWLYFEIFDSLSARTPEERLEWSEILSNCITEDEVEKQRNQNWDDYSHQAFVCDHLSDLLELLLDPEQLTASFHSSHSSLLSREAVKALSFLIEGTVSRARKVYPLHELALWQPLHAASGFSKTSKTFSFCKLEAWLRACLTVNPFGPSACLKSGKKLAWAHQVEGTTKRAKIACNTHVAPRMHRIVVMSQVYKQTLAKSSDTLVGAHVRIHRCNESFIYLLSPLRSVTIEKCRNSTFVLGPVATALHLHDCENLKVIAVCHRLSISSTTGCTFHVMTPSRPLILSGNQRVTFAPFHTHYPLLEDHMARTGLATVPNYWDNPMVVCREGSDTSVFQLLPPCEFYIFIIPFEMEGDTAEIPGGLPSAYQKALAQREEKIQIWQKTVKEARLTKEQRKQFQVLVENKFYEWLINTGHRQQLDSLVPPTAASKQVAG
ncbi:TBCC domain-containing protein 1 isoform X2 [Meriones unguiculatus]|uniref:TBCC domain-containing protein 1 isoform X2 n=1 Tax=Meriones unguiculatus TaxID=10047 RepID=UPI00293E4BF3|nr:TBCC domain-containing protein 1 isoform X2 [Meriones unguiculatus]